MSDLGQNIVIGVSSVLFLISIGMMFFGFRRLDANPIGASIGVNSEYAKWAEFVTSIFTSYLPISLIWLGVFLTMITAQNSFMIPSGAAGLACVVVKIFDFVAVRAYDA